MRGTQRWRERRTTASTVSLWVALGLASLVTEACTTSIEGGPPPPPQPAVVTANGRAIVDWTIGGMKDPAQCRATGAATLHVTLYGSGGAFAGEYVQDCAAFATTIDGLYPDRYTGTAELADANGRPRTTSINLQSFDVVAVRPASVALDFPTDSFL
jgi:hypothetical protein